MESNIIQFIETEFLKTFIRNSIKKKERKENQFSVKDKKGFRYFINKTKMISANNTLIIKVFINLCSQNYTIFYLVCLTPENIKPIFVNFLQPAYDSYVTFLALK